MLDLLKQLGGALSRAASPQGVIASTLAVVLLLAVWHFIEEATPAYRIVLILIAIAIAATFIVALIRFVPNAPPENTSGEKQSGE